jgi:SAM-dependent methyltransferase
MPDYSRSHLEKGRDYHEAFEAWPGRALMWELEQRAIRALLGGIEPLTAVDFATGTGRIARLIKSVFPNCRVVGTDISAKMLSVARSEGGGVEYEQLDGRRASQDLGSNSFDLATAFRFFPNAEPELRLDAAHQLSSLLKPGGYLLVNNHRNFWSPTYIIQRLVLSRAEGGMLNSELIKLFTSVGFEVDAHISLGVCPHTEEKSVLPWNALRALERFNYAYFSRAHTAGYNTLFLFRKVT